MRVVLIRNPTEPSSPNSPHAPQNVQERTTPSRSRLCLTPPLLPYYLHLPPLPPTRSIPTPPTPFKIDSAPCKRLNRHRRSLRAASYSTGSPRSILPTTQDESAELRRASARARHYVARPAGAGYRSSSYPDARAPHLSPKEIILSAVGWDRNRNTLHGTLRARLFLPAHWPTVIPLPVGFLCTMQRLQYLSDVIDSYC
ncbi:hypothetical protein C8J57DRAFT_1324200 [Mycena rebaudengoi]|nr:hypothetical protein C8J57DRAFT_1324200 [Mycena rebaudengoi]